MQQPMSRISAWHWFAAGKHPCAADYFRAGSGGGLSRSLEAWMEAGFSRIRPQPFSLPSLRAFRFWARGVHSGEICGGILRDSVDKVGRPYPFLAAGTGPLPGWEQAWDLIPIAMETCWRQMERLATRSFGLLRELEDELLGWLPPAADWARFRAEREWGARAPDAGLEQPRARLQELSGRPAGSRGRQVWIVPVEEIPGIEPMVLFSLWHTLIREAAGGRHPQSVFLGGAQAKTALMVFHRALASEDFQLLWSPQPSASAAASASNA
jgi:type VI secretion system protein ImpM